MDKPADNPRPRHHPIGGTAAGQGVPADPRDGARSDLYQPRTDAEIDAFDHKVDHAFDVAGEIELDDVDDSFDDGDDRFDDLSDDVGADDLDSDDVDGDHDDGIGGDDDLARMALADARSQTRGGSRRGRSKDSRRRTRQQNLTGRNRGGYSGAGPDPERDPQSIGSLLPGYVHDLGWDRPMADATVFARWPALVGADVAAHCEPQSLRDGELRISAESTAWATQLRLLSGTLLARLAAELGPQVVTKLSISGPVAPSWKHGPRSMYRGRGPRDTYG